MSLNFKQPVNLKGDTKNTKLYIVAYDNEDYVLSSIRSELFKVPKNQVEHTATHARRSLAELSGKMLSPERSTERSPVINLYSYKIAVIPIDFKILPHDTNQETRKHVNVSLPSLGLSNETSVTTSGIATITTFRHYSHKHLYHVTAKMDDTREFFEFTVYHANYFPPLSPGEKIEITDDPTDERFFLHKLNHQEIILRDRKNEYVPCLYKLNQNKS